MNKLISTGILLAGLGYCIQSITNAFARPQTASISLGSNPVESFYGSNGNRTLSLNPNYDFVLTTMYSETNICILKINGTAINTSGYANFLYYDYRNSMTSGFSHGTSTISIPAGATVTLQNCSQHLLSGYYVQP